MAEQPELFHETLNDALREIVSALGGAKKVGPLMRPDKSVDASSRWVLDCLNPDREHRFDPDQVLWLLREGRCIGCHGAARYINREAGYADPVPIDTADQAERIVNVIEGASQTLKSALQALERVRAVDMVAPAMRVAK